MSEVESLINIPVEHCSNIFGQFDEYAKVIEKTLKVTIIVRDSSVKVIGAEAAVQRASGVVSSPNAARLWTSLSNEANIVCL